MLRTVFWTASVAVDYVYNQPPRSTQPGHPPWVGAMSISQRAVMLCGWGVKPGMVRVWLAGKTMSSPS